MRIFKVALALILLSGCHQAPDIDVAETDRIDCAIGGSKTFVRTCVVERDVTNPGSPANIMTIRHGDGGYRRLNVAQDGSLRPADGADVATGHSLPDNRLEIALAGDNYRLPTPQ